MDDAGLFNKSESEAEKGYKKALAEAPRVRMSDFKDLYGEETIKKEEILAEEEEKKIINSSPDVREAYFLAKAFEGIVCSKTKEWYGENAEAKLASPYDDAMHGADILLSFRDEEAKEVFSVGVDVTMSKGHVQKFKSIRKEIEEGTLGIIKYFDPREGEKEKIPHVVIGIEGGEAKKMNGEWLEGKDSLNTHWASYEFIVQMLIQLHAFREYAKTERNKEAVHIYDRSIEALQPFFEKTKNNTRDMTSAGAYTLKIIENLKEAGIFFDLKEAIQIMKK
jgi:hypothetical protein